MKFHACGVSFWAMTDFPKTGISLLIVAALMAGAAIAFYLAVPGYFPGSDDSQSAAAVTAPVPNAQSVRSADPGASPDRIEQAEMVAPEEAETQSTAAGDDRTPADYRRAREAKRADRLSAYSRIPATDRARAMAQRWDLTARQEQQLVDILARYSAQVSALGEQALSDGDRAGALRQIQTRQMQEIAPIIGDSPALQRSMQKFLEAGHARGGTIVRSQTD